jgi:large subunit ribosomal protein L29
MKAKEKEAKKNLSVSELEAELRSAREKHFKLRFKHRVTPLGNPLELRNLRRHIARLQTWVREKSLAQAKTEK